MKTAISSSFTTTLSFIRMFLGYFQTTLRPFETSGQSNVATLRHLRPRDDLHAPLKGVLEGRGVLAEVRDRRVDGFGVLLGGRLDRVGLGPEEVDALDEAQVELVEGVELALLDTDVGGNPAVPLLGVSDAALELLHLEDDPAEWLKGGDLVGGRDLRAPRLEPVLDAQHPVGDLDAEERVGRAQVLAPPVPGKPRDVHLDFLDESAVVFHALA